MKKRFLVVSPHPDDAELGLGGTIIKLKAQGHKVFIIDLTSGEPTPFGTEKKRKQETKKASRLLGVDDRVNLRLPNRYLFDGKKARLLLAEKIRIFRPDVLFAPYFEDAHPDHIQAAKITEAARFSAKFTKVGLKGEPHYPFYLFYYFCAHLRITPRFSFLVDISAQFEKKIKVMCSYRSQFVENPKSSFIVDCVTIHNKFLGELIHSQYAEAVYSKEAVKVNDISVLL